MPQLLDCQFFTGFVVFQTMSGIFQILSTFQTICCQKLADDSSALPQLCLAMKDGPEHIRRFRGIISKPHVRPGRVQIFEPFHWFKGYKVAFLCLCLVDFSVLGKGALTYGSCM